MNEFLTSRPQVRSRVEARLGFIGVLLALFAGGATGKPPGGQITPNFKDVDFTELVEHVAAATGKNFIIDWRVHAHVTMISPRGMSSSAFYDAFLALLPACGLTTAQRDGLVFIYPDKRPAKLIQVSLRDFSSCYCVAQ